jgi:hypothetical protein
VTSESTDAFLSIEVLYVDESGRLVADRTLVREVSDRSLTFRFDLTDLDLPTR